MSENPFRQPPAPTEKAPSSGEFVPGPITAGRIISEARIADWKAVKLVGIDIPFWEMVGLLVKISLASIPAVIILTIIGFLILGVLGGLGAALGS